MIEIGYRHTFDHTLLISVSTNTVVDVGKVLTIHGFEKLFIVGNDDELEIRLSSPSLDDSM